MILNEREKEVYAAQGRVFEQILIFTGQKPLPPNMQTDDGYIELALQIQKGIEEYETEGDTKLFRVQE